MMKLFQWLKARRDRRLAEWNYDNWNPGYLRRKINGQWQRRLMTEEEAWEKSSQEAW